jgi:hypothetical protein
MKNPRLRTILKFNAAALLALSIIGCASDRQAMTTPKPIDHPKPPDHAKTASVHYPLGPVHTAAENSLAVSGFKVAKADDVFIEANRPRHIGLFLGSGGEVCRVWLRSVAPDETEVKVDSIKTFVGMLGQKEWDSTVLAEILRDLNK